MSQLARSLTASPSVARPNFISRASKAAASFAQSDFGAEGRSSDNEVGPSTAAELLAVVARASRRGMTTAHRPVTVQPNPGRIVPLMQGFHSSAAPAARIEVPTMDFTVLPIMDMGSASDMAQTIRVPFMPDNFTPDRSTLSAEAPDAPLPAAEISVVAAHPDKVLSALTEVEGIGLDGIELKFVHERATATRSSDGHYMITDVWHGMLDDVFGGQKKPALA
ncbi:hypothetical protein RB595_002958 [Gaeumannomyces hyphopodioides]